MTLGELKSAANSGQQPQIEVHGVDPSIYLIFVLSAGERRPLVDHRGKTLSYRSRSKAFDALRETGVQRADFVHKSAFDEMVGVGDGVPTEHRETVTLSD
jgi:hypothetical protein